MSKKIQIKRGLKVGIPTLDSGELGYATDTKELFIGVDSENILVNDVDGGEWSLPLIINFTEFSSESVKFTISNQENYEITAKYGLETPPTESFVVLGANSTSEEFEILDLVEDTNYILYAQSFLDNNPVSIISEHPFIPTDSQDPTYSPGPLFFAQGAFVQPSEGFEELGPVGFYGTVTAEEFAGTGNDLSDVLDTLGFVDGEETGITYQNTTDPLLKFRHNNKIKFITQKTIGHSVEWNHIQSILSSGGGNGVYGGKEITLNGVTYKARLMRGWGQVSGQAEGVTTPNYETGPLYAVDFSVEAPTTGVNWPTNTSGWSANNPNEWNTLIFPIHTDSSTQTQTSGVPNWASYSDSDLQVTSGNGRASSTQETVSGSYRLFRGDYDLAHIKSAYSLEAFGFSGAGLRLVFEIDVPGETVYYPTEVNN